MPFSFEPLEVRSLLSGVSLSNPLPIWVAEGPAPNLNAQVTNIPSDTPSALNDPVSAAIEAIAVNPGNSQQVFLGTVNGGVWKTNDITATPPVWQPLTDNFTSLQIASLQFDPTDATNQTLVAGIGETSNIITTLGPRSGLLKTTDGGSTWKELGDAPMALGGLQGESITAVAPRGNTIAVGVGPGYPDRSPQQGLFLSTNGGTTFQSISGQNGLPNGPVFDIASDPSNASRLYAAVGGAAGGVFRIDNINNLATGWVNLTGNITPNTAISSLIGNQTSNMKLAVSGADTNTVYFGINDNGQAAGVFYTNNQGGAWTQMDLPQTLDESRSITAVSNASPVQITVGANESYNTGDRVRISGATGVANGDYTITKIDAKHFSLDATTAAGGGGAGGTAQLIQGINGGGQGFPNFSLAADPNHANIVYIAGDDQEVLGADSSIGATNFTVRLFRGDTAVAPGGSSAVPSPQWSPLTNLGTSNGSAPHADSRAIAIANGNLYLTVDGGIFRENSPLDATGQWYSVNGNLQITQFDGISYDSVSHIIFGGAQDTGTPQQTAPNSPIYSDPTVNQGDGGPTAVDDLTSGTQSARYTLYSGNGFGRQIYDQANNLVGGEVDLIPSGGISGFNGFNVIAVSSVAPTAGQSTRLFLGNGTNGGVNGIFESTNAALAASTGAINYTQIPAGPGWRGVNSFFNLPAIAAGGKLSGVTNQDVLYVGSGNQVFVRTTAGGTLAAAAALPASAQNIQGIALDPNNWMTAYVTDGSNVYETTSAGASWSQISGTFTGALLHTIAVVPGTGVNAGVNAVVVGASDGVYRMLTNAPGAWSKVGTAFPNSGVWGLHYSASDDVLVAATSGRGAFEVQGAASGASNVFSSSVLTITGDQDYAGENDTFRVVRDAANPTLLDIYVNGVLDTSGPYALNTLQQINVDGLGGNDTLVIDDSNGLIDVPGGMHYDGGTGFNTLRLVQTGGTTQTSDVYSVGPNPGEGTDTITGPSGTQTVYFQNLAPVQDNVPATTATVNGTNGDNAINYAQGPGGGIFTGNTGFVTVDNQESYEFNNKTNLVLNGLAGSDTINLNDPTVPAGLTGTITVNGGDPSADDKLIVNGIAGVADDLQVTPTGAGSGTIIDPPAPTFIGVSFTGIENLTMVGQLGDADGLDILSTAGNDAYTYTPGATGDAGLVTGTANGSAFGIVPVSFSGFRSFVSPLAFNLGGTDSLTIDATAGNSTVNLGSKPFPLGGVALAAAVNGGTPLFFSSGLVNLALNAVAGNGTFNLTGDGSAATVSLSGAGVTITGGGLAAGTAPLSILGASAINFNNGGGAVSVVDSGSNNTLVVTPTGPNSESVQIAGSSQVIDVTGAATFNAKVSAPGANDTLAVNGTPLDDTFTVGGTVVVEANSSFGTPNTVNFAGFSALQVNGEDGNDTFNVTPGAVPIQVNGGSPIGVKPGDTLNLLPGGGSVTYYAGPTGDSGGFAVVGSQPVSFTGIESFGQINGGGAPALVQGTNGDDDIQVTATGSQQFTISVNQGPAILYTNTPQLYIDTLAGDDETNITGPAAGSNYAWDEHVFVAGDSHAAGGNNIDSLSVETPVVGTLAYAPLKADAGALVYTQTNVVDPASTTITTGAFPVAAPFTSSPGGVEQLALNGEGVGDALSVSGTGSAFVYTPGATADAATVALGGDLPLIFSNLGAAATANLTDTGGAGSLTYNGTAGNDTFGAGAAAAGAGSVTLNSQIPVTTTGITTLTLSDPSGENTYNVAAKTGANATPFTTVNVQGSGHGDPDVLDLAGNGAAATVNIGGPSSSVAGGGLGTVNVSGVGVVNLSDGAGAITVSGTTNPDTFNVTPTSGNSALVSANGVAPQFDLLAAGSLTIGDTNPPDGDQVIVNGTAAGDIIGIARGANTAVTVNSLLAVNVTTADAAALTVASGLGTDTINVTGTGGPPLTVFGGQSPAADVLNVTNATAGASTYTPGATNDSGTLKTPDGTVNFAGMKAISDTALATSTTDSLTVLGTNGNDTITTAPVAGANVAWVNGQAPIKYVGFNSLTLNGRFGNDSFVVSPVGLVFVGATPGINVVGNAASGASNALTVNGSAAADAINYSPAAGAGAVAITGSATVNMNNMASLAINGQGGGDSLTVTTPAPSNTVTYTPGAAVDAGSVAVGSFTPMSFGNLGAAGSLTFANSVVGARTDSLIVNGTAGNDTFGVNAAGVVALNSQIPINTPGIANLTLNGLDGVNSFNVNATAPFPIAINGGNNSAGNTATITGDGTAGVTLDLAAQSVTETGFKPVSFTGTGVVNVAAATGAGTAAINVSGTPGNDSLAVTPTDATTATAQNNGAGPVFHFSNAVSFTADLLGGNNTLVVNGSAGNDTITAKTNAAANPTVTVAQGINSDLPIAYVAADLAALDVNGLNGNDVLVADSTNGPVTPAIHYDGGNGNNSLVLQGGNVGAGGSDTYSPGPGVGQGANTLVFTGANAGTEQVQFVNLSPVIDTVASPNLTVNGTNGDDAINYTQGPNSGGAIVGNATTGFVSVNNLETIEFANKTALAINGLAGADTINLNDPNTPTALTSIAVNGGGATVGGDTLIVNGTAAADTIAYTPSPTDATGAGVTGAGPVPIVFTAMTQLNINGQGGGDSLQIISPAGVDSTTLTPGATFDSGSLTDSNVTLGTLVPVAYSHLGAGGSLNLSDTSGTAVDSLAYNGTANSDVFNVTPAAGGTIQLNNQIPVTTPGVANLRLNGLSGDDQFNLSGKLPYTATTLDGGDPSASDVASLTGGIGPVVVNLGDGAAAPPSHTTITGYGGTVTLIGVEAANLDAGGFALTSIGAAHNDNLAYTPSGPTAGTFTDAGLNTTFNFANVGGAFTMTGGTGGIDQLTVNGSSTRNLFEIDQGNRTVTVLPHNTVVWKTVTIDNTITTLNAQGQSGQDTFQVIPAAGAAPFPLDNLVINVNGANLPSGATNALVLGNSFITTAGTPASLPATSFVVVSRSATPGAGTVRVFQSAIANPDINYANIQVVSPTVAATGTPNGNLLIMGPDANEPNETQATAASLGMAGNIEVSNATIFANNAEFPGVAADNDYYSVTARQTGTLDFIATFNLYSPTLLPAGGQIAMQALDAAGNVIASSAGGAAAFGAQGATANARVRIPVVAGQTYFLHVFGANANGSPNGTVVNGYNLAIVDTPAIAPFNLELSRGVPAGVAGSPDTGDLPPNAPADDTGRSQFDNVTNDNTPRIYLRLSDGIFLNDLPGNGTTDNPPVGVIPVPFSPTAATPGFRVAIFDGNNTQTPVGFANQVAGFPGLYEFDFTIPLADGVHNLTAEVQMVDPQKATETGFGGTSLTLAITIDTAPPPVSFGSPAVPHSGLDGVSDSGVPGQPATIVDRITNVSTPTFYGVAEANTIVRLYVQTTTGNVLVGQTQAVPVDGTNANPSGQWRITLNTDLNNPSLGLGLDGIRNMSVTAEDLAGNVSAPQKLVIFVDTQGPTVNNVNITGSPTFPLFNTKLTPTAVASPTPLINSLDITFGDQPVRVGPDFVYPAVNPVLATTASNYALIGEHTGVIPITLVTLVDSTSAGGPGNTKVTLHFPAKDTPLPDDRYTLSVSDAITDNAGNALQGSFNGVNFPTGLASGNGSQGQTFVGAFTVDSRAHIGNYSSGTVDLDINGNGTFDPNNSDANNRDAAITIGYPTDRLFDGNFSSTYSQGAPHTGAANGFDKLATYGPGPNGTFQWTYNLDGAGKTITAPVVQPIAIDGLPVAGNFDGVPADGDQVGLFDGKAWYLDVLDQGFISAADIATPATATHPAGKLPSNMAGLPFVGNFDGYLDLATYQNGVVEFDLASLEPNHVLSGNWNVKLNLNALFPSSVPVNTVTARPVAGYVDGLGQQSSFGLWAPSRTDNTPGVAEWYILNPPANSFNLPAPVPAASLFSSGMVTADSAAHQAALQAGNLFFNLVHPFQDAPLGGQDTYAQFGNQFSLPLLGIWDPPTDGVVATGGDPAGSSDLSTQTASAWISDLYSQLLQRSASATDTGYWVSQIEQGATPAQVAQTIVTGNEYRFDQINKLYQEYLGRAAEPAGLTWYANIWNNTGGPEQVQADIISSPEFLATAHNQYPTLSASAAWVTTLYQRLLGRSPDPDGLSGWVQAYNTSGPAAVVLGIVTSPEYHYDSANSEFETYLGRSLDSASGQMIIDAINNGLTKDQLLMNIVSSTEYVNKK